jgi:hypothetical protein
VNWSQISVEHYHRNCNWRQGPKCQQRSITEIVTLSDRGTAILNSDRVSNISQVLVQESYLSITLHLIVGPWSLFQFLDFLHSR